MPRRRRPGQAGNRPAQGVDEELEVFSDWLRVAKVVVAFEQVVEKWLLPGAPHLMKFKWPDLVQASAERRGIDKPRRRLLALRCAPSQRILYSPRTRRRPVVPR